VLAVFLSQCDDHLLEAAEEVRRVFRVRGVGCGVWSVGCWGEGIERCVWSVGCGVWGMGCGVWGMGYGVWGVGYGVWGVEWGCRVWGMKRGVG
jgi:hypothetical protein